MKKAMPKSDTLYNIGERIKEYMDYANMTARDLSKAINVTPTTISLMVNAKTAPSIETLHQIALALGIEDWQLFTSKNLVENIVKPEEKENVPQPPTITCPHCGKPINVKLEID